MHKTESGPEAGLVCIIDDDEMVRESTRMLVQTTGLAVSTYADARGWLEDAEAFSRCDCLVLDVRMPGMSGLELQERLLVHHRTLPIIFISGHGDVPMAVRAMRHGAVDFLPKPFHAQDLLDRVQQSVAHYRQCREQQQHRQKVLDRLAQLTPREHQVLQQLLDGHQNKLIAANLDISIKTVEQHRARVMEKMHARTLAELFGLMTVVGERPAGAVE